MNANYNEHLHILYLQLQQTYSTIVWLQRRVLIQESLASNILNHINEVHRVNLTYATRYNHFSAVVTYFERDFDTNFNSLISRKTVLQDSIPAQGQQLHNYTELDWELYQYELHEDYIFQLGRHHF